MIEAFEYWLRRQHVRRFLIPAHDIVLVTCAFPMSIILGGNFNLDLDEPIAYGTFILFFVALVVLRIMGLQQNMWRYSSPGDLLKVAKAISVIAAIFFAILFLIDRLDSIPRSVPVIFWLVSFVGLCSTRIFYCDLINSIRGRFAQRRFARCYRVVIAGSLEAASALIQSLWAQSNLPIQIVGVISNGAERGRILHGIEILGNNEQIAQIQASLDIAGRYPHAIVVDDMDAKLEQSLSDKLSAESIGIPVVRSSAIDALPSVVSSDDFFSNTFPWNNNVSPYTGIKRFIDVTLSLSALVFLLPLLALVALAILLLNGGPILFVQAREGRKLHEFSLLKFRTMKPPFNKSGQLIDEASRVTWLGSLLRSTRIDELPQLYNVLCGDMSIVGPRPLLRRDMPNEPRELALRYSIRPGITGWAQVNGGKKINNDIKIPLDLYYVKNFSFALDVKILIMTIIMMFTGEKTRPDIVRQAKNLDIYTAK